MRGKAPLAMSPVILSENTNILFLWLIIMHQDKNLLLFQSQTL